MSRNIYDNWERLVAAVLKREEIWQMFHEQSKNTSINTSISSDFSRQTPSEFANNRSNPPFLPSTPLTLSRANEDAVVHLGQVTRFSLHQLQVATDNFNSKNVVRKVGYGKIYTGQFGDGCLVEVVRVKLEERGEDDEELQFQREVEVGSLAAHCNLLPLRGFCRTSIERLLVYPFMANGSVAACLRERANSHPPLDWCTRKRIALGSARGLVYLHEHCDPKIIHCAIKAANIFLDEEFQVFIGNFSRAKLVKYKEAMADTSPEYLSSVDCPEKIDVFSYGVLLLELITGLEDSELAQLPIHRNVPLLDWVKGLLEDKKMETLVDTSLQGNYAEDEVEKLAQIALICTQRSPTKRPKMSEILRMLEGDLLAGKWKKKLHK